MGEYSDFGRWGIAAKGPLTSSVADLRAAGLKDAHHVIQDAAVRDLPGYSSRAAPGIQLAGPESSQAGQKRFVTNRNAKVYEMTYDALGRTKQTIQPGGRTLGVV